MVTLRSSSSSPRATAAAGRRGRSSSTPAPPWQDGEVVYFRLTDVDGKPAGVATFAIDAGTNDKGEPGSTIERTVNAQGAVETITAKVAGKATARLPPTSSAGIDGSAEWVDAASPMAPSC